MAKRKFLRLLTVPGVASRDRGINAAFMANRCGALKSNHAQVTQVTVRVRPRWVTRLRLLNTENGPMRIDVCEDTRFHDKHSPGEVAVKCRSNLKAAKVEIRHPEGACFRVLPHLPRSIEAKQETASPVVFREPARCSDSFQPCAALHHIPHNPHQVYISLPTREKRRGSKRRRVTQR